MSAPDEFVTWLARHEHKDSVYEWVYHYHPRSDAHSIALCTSIVEDLVAASESMRLQALANSIVYGINTKHMFPNGKKKTLDLAIGTVKQVKASTRLAGIICPGEIDRVFLACEAKTVHCPNCGRLCYAVWSLALLNKLQDIRAIRSLASFR